MKYSFHTYTNSRKSSKSSRLIFSTFHLSTALPTVQFGIIDRLVECMMKYMFACCLKKKWNLLYCEEILQTFPIWARRKLSRRYLGSEFHWIYLMKILTAYLCVILIKIDWKIFDYSKKKISLPEKNSIFSCKSIFHLVFNGINFLSSTYYFFCLSSSLLDGKLNGP